MLASTLHDPFHECFSEVCDTFQQMTKPRPRAQAHSFAGVQGKLRLGLALKWGEGGLQDGALNLRGPRQVAQGKQCQSGPGTPAGAGELSGSQNSMSTGAEAAPGGLSAGGGRRQGRSRTPWCKAAFVAAILWAFL